MDIFGAARGWYNQILTEAAFDVNVCVQSQDSDECLKKMVNAVRRYRESSDSLKVIDQLEEAYKVNRHQAEKENEN